MECKTNFSRRLNQFDGLTWLTLTPRILRQIYTTVHWRRLTVSHVFLFVLSAVTDVRLQCVFPEHVDTYISSVAMYISAPTDCKLYTEWTSEKTKKSRFLLRRRVVGSSTALDTLPDTSTSVPARGRRLFQYGLFVCVKYTMFYRTHCFRYTAVKSRIHVYW